MSGRGGKDVYLGFVDQRKLVHVVLIILLSSLDTDVQRATVDYITLRASVKQNAASQR